MDLLKYHKASLTPLATRGDLTYYVDAVAGDDANDGLAAGAGRALKTIQAAINKIPQIVNHTININVAVGTYPESIALSGFTGKGRININGGANLAAAVNYLVNSITVANCALQVVIGGFKANSAGVTQSFYIAHSVNTEFDYCISDVANAYGFRTDYCKAVLYQCISSNHNTAGIIGYSCNTTLWDCYGSGNAYGINAAYGAIISQFGATGFGKRIRGTSGNVAQQGGIIGPQATWANVTLYVRTDGSDDNDGSANTAGGALRTIQEAIRRLPQRIDHTVSINVATGVYAEDVTVKGFIGHGTLGIYGDNVMPDASHPDRTINGIIVSACFVRVDIRGFKATRTNAAGFNIDYCNFVEVNQCKCVEATVGANGVSVNYGRAYIANCALRARQIGIFAGVNSIVASWGNDYGTEANNSIGLKAETGSILSYYTGQPPGNTARAQSYGGTVTPGSVA